MKGPQSILTVNGGSSSSGRVAVRVIRTDEESVIARSVMIVLHLESIRRARP